MKGFFVVALVVLGVLNLPVPASSHDGDVDGYGCHLNPLHGGYHCHRGPLAGRSFMTKSEALTAIAETTGQDRDFGVIPSILGVIPSIQRILNDLPGIPDPSCR